MQNSQNDLTSSDSEGSEPEMPANIRDHIPGIGQDPAYMADNQPGSSIFNQLLQNANQLKLA